MSRNARAQSQSWPLSAKPNEVTHLHKGRDDDRDQWAFVELARYFHGR